MTFSTMNYHRSIMLRTCSTRILLCLQRSLCSKQVDEIRVRFAPSPTGNLHLGGLRTALYNYLFARSQRGTFVLRIEDTDQQRLVPGTAQQIESTLDRYKLYRDEGPTSGGNFGPYVQSQRIEIYRQAVEQLLHSKHAYRCFCTKTRLEMLRREATRRHEVPKYDNHCRALTESEVQKKLENGEEYAVRFKLSQKEVFFKDEVFGDIVQKTDEGDFVLQKSDSFPTYHLANIVDDHHMRISHVIRGCEWLTSVSKHMQLYEAFGWSPPVWVHLPLLVRSNNKKLSKRDKDAYVEFYDIERGYLPIAVLNYLCRNGSGIRNFDPTFLYSLEELTEKFDIHSIGKRNIMLDEIVLDAYGHKAIEKADVDKHLVPEIMRRLQQTLPEAAMEFVTDPSYVKKVLDLFQRTDQKLSYLEQLTSSDFKYYFLRPTNSKKLLSDLESDRVLSVLRCIIDCEDWSLDNLKKLASEQGVKSATLFQIIRLTLIDCRNGPPVAELFQFFGKNECLKRFSEMSNMLKEQNVVAI